MDQALAPSLAPSPAIVFRDGMGERRRVSDPTGKESVDLWYLSTELSGAALEAGLRDRVKRFASFSHAAVNRVHSVDRVNNGTTLAVISESAKGIRLSDLLAAAEKHHLAFDLGTALYIIRQCLPAVGALYEHDHEIGHGALACERLVITPQAQLVLVDHAMGAALEQLRYSRERYWKDLRIAVPRSAGLPHFDHRVDVMQAGVLALSLVLGRALHDDEYPAKVPELVGSAWATSAAGDLQPLPSALRSWLSSALQIDLRSAFSSIAQAAAEFERMLSSVGHAAEPASLERFLGRYQEKAGDVDRPAPAPTTIRNERPAEPIATGPRLVPPVPRAEPSLRVDSPRVETAPRAEPTPRADAGPRLAAVPRIEPAPRVEPLPKIDRVESAPRFEAIPREEPPSPRIETPLFEPAVKSEPAPAPRADAFLRADTPTTPPSAAIETSADGASQTASSRFDLTPRTDFSNFDFTPEAEEVADMPPPKSRLSGSRRSSLTAAAVVIVALTGGGMLAARRYALTTGPAADTGTLTITSNPTGAQVLVDRESKGTTPTTLTLPAGTHSVELRGAGDPRTISVAVTAGAQLSQYIELANGHSNMGRLQVRTEPAGALVTIDALPRGTSPITIGNLDPGEHTIVLTGDTGTATQSVTIEAGVTASLNVPLVAREAAPQSGWISVTSPVDVQLFEGGRLLGSSQTDRIMVQSGSHQLDLVNDALGYRASRSVQVAPGKVANVAVKLPMGSVAINAIPWAEVFIDGNRVGETPIGNQPAAIGNHEIVFRNPELGEKTQTVTVTLTAPARLSVDMRKK
jgi:hypothetical protein